MLTHPSAVQQSSRLPKLFIAEHLTAPCSQGNWCLGWHICSCWLKKVWHFSWPTVVSLSLIFPWIEAIWKLETGGAVQKYIDCDFSATGTIGRSIAATLTSFLEFSIQASANFLNSFPFLCFCCCCPNSSPKSSITRKWITDVCVCYLEKSGLQLP